MQCNTEQTKFRGKSLIGYHIIAGWLHWMSAGNMENVAVLNKLSIKVIKGLCILSLNVDWNLRCDFVRSSRLHIRTYECVYNISGVAGGVV